VGAPTETGASNRPKANHRQQIACFQQFCAFLAMNPVRNTQTNMDGERMEKVACKDKRLPNSALTVNVAHRPRITRFLSALIS
jgi:hypothetical protein